MIYRKWSLLTGPAAILGGIVSALVVANFIFVDKDPFVNAYQKKRQHLVKVEKELDSE